MWNTSVSFRKQRHFPKPFARTVKEHGLLLKPLFYSQSVRHYPLLYRIIIIVLAEGVLTARLDLLQLWLGEALPVSVGDMTSNYKDQRFIWPRRDCSVINNTLLQLLHTYSYYSYCRSRSNHTNNCGLCKWLFDYLFVFLLDWYPIELIQQGATGRSRICETQVNSGPFHTFFLVWIRKRTSWLPSLAPQSALPARGTGPIHLTRNGVNVYPLLFYSRKTTLGGTRRIG